MNQIAGCFGPVERLRPADAVRRMVPALSGVQAANDWGALAGEGIVTDGRTWALISGAHRWRDDSLQEMARIRGPGLAVLEAFRRHGPDFLAKLAGRFALALVTPGERSVLLAVDRMGIEPLAYAATPSMLAFASGTEPLTRHPLVPARLSAQSLFDYCFFHMVPSPATIYRDIHKLEPGQYLEWHDGRARTGRYWIPKFHANGSRNERECAAELRQHLQAAVRRCAPDEHTGAFLSGGLDSSTVTGVLADIAGRPVRTYSIGFLQSGYDELEYARTAARHFHATPREYYVEHRDVEAAIPRIAAAYDEPFGNSSAVPTLMCAQLAREEGMKLLLAGDGGDEIFGGNERYAKQQVFDVYNRLPRRLRRSFIERILAGPQMESVPLLGKLASYVAQARIPMPMRLHSYNFLFRSSLGEVFEPQFLQLVDVEHPAKLLDKTWNEAPTDALVDRMLYLDWKFTLADNDLRKVNRMCEQAGVRVSYPLLDDDLVEFSTRLPPDWKVHRGTLRYFYKRALTGFLPDAVIRKTKHGFGLPFGEWLKQSDSLQASVQNALQALKRRGIVRPAFVDTLIHEHRGGHASYYGTMVWVFVMLERWLDAHPSAEAADH
jgi:asparagine synthase (glutamine-hydrolysing)